MEYSSPEQALTETNHKHTVILSCRSSPNSDIEHIAIDKHIHAQLNIPLSSNISTSISQIIDVGVQVKNLQFESFHTDSVLRDKIEALCASRHQKELEDIQKEHERQVADLRNTNQVLEEQNRSLETKMECVKSTFENECRTIALEQSRQVQHSTANLQQHLQSSIEDMKMKMVQFHSQTASTKSVGNKGEECVMQYITSHYPHWSVRDTHGEAHAGDFHTYLNEDTWILNEVKCHKGSIRTEQVRKFYRDIDAHEPTAAILFSLHSNIVGKRHGHYELRGKTHVFFLAHCFTNMNCIQFVHSMCEMLFRHTQERCSSPSSNSVEEQDTIEQLQQSHNEYKREQDRVCRVLQQSAEQSVHALRSHTKYMIGVYEKNIQHDKKQITELKKRLQEWDSFEQNHYINTDETTSSKFPWKCTACDVLMKTHGQLYKHITSVSHCK
jgi:hypothetical protein